MTQDDMELIAARALIRAKHHNSLVIAIRDRPTYDEVGEVVDEAINDSPTILAAIDAGIDAAVPPAVDAEIIARDLVEGGGILEADIAFAVVDEDGRRTWIEAADDGGLTDHAADKIAEFIAGAVAMSEGSGYAFVVEDDDGRLTEVAIGEDGRFAQWVIDSIAGRIAAPTTEIVCYGDSLTAGTGSSGEGYDYPSLLADLTGRTVVNNGIGGDTSAGIAARQNGQPFLLDPVGGSFLASGTVEVVVTTETGVTFTNPRTFTGTVAGIRGELVRADDIPLTYTFEQIPAGDAVAVTSPQRFYTEEGATRRPDIHIYWAGANNSDDPDQVVADVQAMVVYQSTDRYVAMGPLNNTAWPEGHARHTTTLEIEERLRAAYGNRFLNIRRWLIDYGLVTAGITPTGQDTTDIGNDVVPESLRDDAIHLNDTGYELVAAQVAQRLEELELI